MKLAVIPARGGSKRIPRKNIRNFCGKPMIAWSIEAAIKSKAFDHIMVSTDDDEIAVIAKQYGAEVPLMRPLELSNDTASTIPVVKHAIEWYLKNDLKPEMVCCIYATAPFVTDGSLNQGLEVISNNDIDYTFSVTSYAFPIQRAIRINENHKTEMFEPKNFNVRSQDLEEAYHDAGQFYWGKADAWLASKPIFDSQSVPIILPRHRVQDIDTDEDWIRAEWMFKALQTEQT